MLRELLYEERYFATFLLVTVVLIQIALGGWVSANYAALACPDLPGCMGRVFPPMDFANATRSGSTDKRPTSSSSKPITWSVRAITRERCFTAPPTADFWRCR